MAAQSGVEAGDVIKSVDGTAVGDLAGLAAALGAGARTLSVLRGEETVEVSLGE